MKHTFFFVPFLPLFLSIASPLPKGGNHYTADCKMPTAGLHLLKQSEAFVPGFYSDIQGVQTIGYGHACPAHPGTCDNLSPPLTEKQATTLLAGDLDQYEKCVAALPNSSGLGEYQFAALVDFAYNAGCGSLQTEFQSVMQSASTDSDFGIVCTTLETADTKGGLAGIINRRKKEADLCKKPSKKKCGCKPSSYATVYA